MWVNILAAILMHLGHGHVANEAAKIVRCPRYQGKPTGHVFDLSNFVRNYLFLQFRVWFSCMVNILLDVVSPIDMKQKE